MNQHPPEQDSNSDTGMEIIESDFPSSDITAEKNLWHIFKISFLLPKRVFNIASTASFFAIVLCYAIFEQGSSQEIRGELLIWAERGFSFSVGILGFLVAGVAIFTAANDVSLFTHLARVRHKKSGVSYLKYNFVALMYVFIVYIFLAFSCFIIQIFNDMDPFWDRFFILISNYLFRIQPDTELVAGIMNRFAYVLLSTLIFYCLLLLKTFIFDIYALIMVSVRWNFEEEEAQRKSEAQKNDADNN